MRHQPRSLAFAIALAAGLPLGVAAESPPVIPDSTAVQLGMSGAWFDPAAAGQGLVVNVLSPHRAVALWNTFATDGRQVWLTGDGTIDGDTITFTASITQNGRFPGTPGAGTPATTPWGSFTLRFRDCTSAGFAWAPTAAGFTAGSSEVTRLSKPAGLLCDEGLGAWTWSDLGSPGPRDPTEGEGQTAVVVGNEVLVATRDGVWRRRLDGTGGWSRAGMPGFDTWFLGSDRGRLFAAGKPGNANERPFYVSHDGGRTWENAQSSFRDPVGDIDEPLADVVVSPRDPNVLYGSWQGGPGIGVSLDGGRTWKRTNGQTDSFFAYHCHIAVLPDQPYRIYQGCEVPLDFITIGYYDIDPNDATEIGEITPLAGTNYEGLPTTDNRRPQKLLASPARPGTVYVGIEGGLIALPADAAQVTGPDALETVYFSPMEENGTEVPYIYMRGIWIDPREPSHLLFGGGLNGPNPEVFLYETRDHGRTLSALEPPFALPNPTVDTILPLDESGDRFVVVVQVGADDFSDLQPRVLLLERDRSTTLP